MDAQIRELALGIWFGCKASGFLRETAGRWAIGPLGHWAIGPLGRWALGVGRWALGVGRWAAQRLSGSAAQRLSD